MPSFALRNPYLIIVGALIVTLLGVTAFVEMPVDVFPDLKIPAVVVATFYAGMPPAQVEMDITTRFERFFTLGNGVEHIESRSLPGVSMIKVYFHSNVDVNAAASSLANLAMADLRHMPPGTLPPIVLAFDASSLPVTLVTVSGKAFNETMLRDQAQYNVRNQLATVSGASVPPPFGGKYRQIMVYVNREALQARGLTLMDVVHALNKSNLILPAGDAKIGPTDYYIYSNSMIPNIPTTSTTSRSRSVPGRRRCCVGDVGQRRGRLPDSIQRGADQRPALGLSCRCSGRAAPTLSRWLTASNDLLPKVFGMPPGMKLEAIFDQSHVYPRRGRQPGARGGFGRGAGVADDPDLPGQLPLHIRDLPVDPALDPGRRLRSVLQQLRPSTS